MQAQQMAKSNSSAGTATPAAVVVPQTSAGLTAGSVPRLLQVSGTLHPAAQTPDSSIAKREPNNSTTVLFSLYEFQDGGSPLWSETQSVQIDEQGRYTVLLGATQPAGLPLDLFMSGKALWLGVQPETAGASEEPRVLLVAVPYALKAVDADTLGGLPPSAFLQAAGSAGAAAYLLTGPPGSAASAADFPDATSVTGAGTADYIPRWVSASKIANSVLFQSGTGSTAKIGINTTTPASTLDIGGGGTVRGALSLPATGTATSTSGNDSEPLTLAASVFNGTVSAPIAQTFQLQAEPVGNNTGTASGSLNLLYGSGTSVPAETGLSIANNGVITFAPGQTFPGTGTVTSVGAGPGLIASPSPITTSGTLSVDATKVPLLASANTFTANQTVSGNVTATSFSGNGAGLTNLQGANVQGAVATAANALSLGGSPPSAYQPAGYYAILGSNTFSAMQTVSSGDVSISNGDLDLPQTSATSVGVVNMNGVPFIHACCSNTNAFVGASAGNFTSTGTNNTAIGFQAFLSDTTGYSNLAAGYAALENNTTGIWNTAVGNVALANNTTGFDNIAIGGSALQNETSGRNNIGIGLQAGLNVTTTSNNIEIGNSGVSGDSGAIRIGTAGTQTSTYIAGIYGVNTSGIAVYVNSNGQLGTVSSSRRYKEDIHDMADASSGLLRLRPVTFRYKQPFSDGSKPVQYGLIAEEVAEVYPDLVVRSADGQIQTVKYQVLDPMLLNELQKQNATITAQQEQIHSLEERLARLEAAVAGTPTNVAGR